MIDRRLVLIIAALAVFALATQALVWVLAPREEESAFVGPPRSDYTLTDFTLDALDERGQHSFSMVAPRMARRQDDGSIFVSTPSTSNNASFTRIARSRMSAGRSLKWV